jgi:chaperonin GroES
MAKLVPLNNNVIVKRLEGSSMSPGGIIIPEVSREKPTKGAVIAVGPGTRLDTGVIVPIGVSVGDVVLLGSYKGTEIEVNEERLLVLKAEDILCVEEQREAAEAAA